MNLSPLLDAAGTLAGAVLTVCVPIVTLKITSWLGVNMDAQHRDALNSALQTGLGKALQFGQTAGDQALANVTIKNAALAGTIAYVNANAANAKAYFGLTDADIAEKAGAKLATLLHVTNKVPADEPGKAETAAAMLAKTAPAADPVAAQPYTPAP